MWLLLKMLVCRSLSCMRWSLMLHCNGKFTRRPVSFPWRSTSANQWGKADCSSVNVKRRNWKSYRMLCWNTALTTAASHHRPVIRPGREVSYSVLGPVSHLIYILIEGLHNNLVFSFQILVYLMTAHCLMLLSWMMVSYLCLLVPPKVWDLQ